jgi:capsular exopolysaccharide synthesis family protein
MAASQPVQSSIVSQHQPSVDLITTQTIQDKGFSLGELWKLILRRRFWFGITFGLVMAVMGILSLRDWFFYPIYQSTFRLLVSDPLEDKERGGTNELDQLARFNTSVNTPNLIQVLGSPMILEPIARRLGISERDLNTSVDVSPTRDSDVINITLRWGNPNQGKILIEALAKEYLDYSLRQRQEKLKQGLKFLDEQAPGLQQRVSELQQQLAVFRRANTMLSPDEQSRQLELDRGSLARQLRSLKQTEAQLLGMKMLVESGQLVSPFIEGAAPIIESVDQVRNNIANNIQGAFTPLLNELVNIEGQLATAKSTFKTDSPLVQSLIARRNRIRPLLQKREQDAITSSLQVNLSQQVKVGEQIQDLGKVFNKNPALIKQYEALQQRLEIARENLGSYLESREQFRLEVAQRTAPWQMLSPPSFSAFPVEPDLKRNLLLSLFLASAAGVGVAFLRDRADYVFHSQSEVESQLSLPVLATIPYLPFSTEETIQQCIKDLGSEGVNELDSERVNDLLDSEQRFALRESLRNFYHSLKVLRAGKSLRIIAISSSAANEGKSTTTALLGGSLANLGMKVLLVDGDLRRARLHRRFGLDNSRGFTELFGEQPPSVDDLYQWTTPNLAVLTSGPMVPDPARLLSSTRCAEVINEIKKTPFDLVIFDTPPALELVDALLITEHLDGLIILVSIGKVRRDLPIQLIRKINSLEIDMLGLVCNHRVFYNMGSSYEYGYGYGYGSRYGDDDD